MGTLGFYFGGFVHLLLYFGRLLSSCSLPSCESPHGELRGLVSCWVLLGVYGGVGGRRKLFQISIGQFKVRVLCKRQASPASLRASCAVLLLLGRRFILIELPLKEDGGGSFILHVGYFSRQAAFWNTSCQAFAARLLACFLCASSPPATVPPSSSCHGALWSSCFVRNKEGIRGSSRRSERLRSKGKTKLKASGKSF